MILRRPYAFLVKYFKIIHAILLLGASFLVYRTYKLITFFGSYIRDDSIGKEASKMVSKYVPLSLIAVSLFMVLLSGIIIYLLRYKNKPIKMYLFMLIFYALYSFMLFWMTSFIADLDFTTPGIRFISIIRDIFRFSLILNVVVIGMCFVRAIGFDITKFDFKKDVLDLGVTEKDNEEYEFELKIDKDKIKSQTKKRIRYIKYFYKENKFIFRTISFILIAVVFLSVIKLIMGIEKVYKQNDYFETDELKLKVVESYKTKTDSFGNKLNSQYFYIIVKMEYQNKKPYTHVIDPTEMKIAYGDRELVSPTTTENSKFTEFGVNYFKQELEAYETRTLNFIFEIPVEYYDDSFQLKYLYNIEYVSNELKYNYKKVTLNPKITSKEATTVNTATLGEELSFEGSVLGNTKITIQNATLNDVFYYNIIKCSETGCITRNRAINAVNASNFDLTLMRINYKIDFDYDTLGQKYTNDTFISRFGTMRFEVNGKEYNNRLELVDVTPYPTKDYSFIQVRDKLKKADKIYLDFTIRDKIYTYVILDKTVKEGE